MPLIGAQPFSNRVWAPGVKLSTMSNPAEEWDVDPTLPPLGTDPRYPTSDQIVIPRGRILAVRTDTTTYTGRAVLTIADGKNNKPAGYAETNLLRRFQEKDQWMPSMHRRDLIEVPYVSAINGAYGTLSGGDRITAYYGTATSTTVQVPNDKGKIVKWVPKTLYCKTAAASAIVELTSANLPAFTPTVILAMNAGTSVTTGTISVGWNSTRGKWIATFGQSVTDTLYTFGQNSDQIAGEVIRIEPISTTHHLSGWLDWVTDNFLAWEYPPQMMRVPTTDVTDEVPATVTAGVQYTLANKPIAPWKTITVKVTGSVLAPDGTSTTLTGDTLSAATDIPLVDYTLGTYYNINPVTGDLFFTNNLTVSSVTVSYSYETSYRNGRLFNPGIIGLTDGRYSGVPGTPANLEVSGVVGSLRCIIY